MTRTLDRGRAASSGDASYFRVREERDPRVLAAALGDDRALAVFALGHLEPELVPFARFWTAEAPDGRHAVVMHGSGSLGRTSVIVGDPSGVDAALSLHPGPRSAYLATCAPEHLPAIERAHAVTDALTDMMRMHVEAHRFLDAAGSRRRHAGDGCAATTRAPSTPSTRAEAARRAIAASTSSKASITARSRAAS